MAQFVEFLSPTDASGEPVSLAEAKVHAGWDADNLLMDDEISNILIPGARQLAEARTGSAIRPARYIQRLQEFPKDGGMFAITHGLVSSVESVTYLTADGDRSTLDASLYEAAVIDRETLVSPLPGSWPDVKRGLRAVEVTYTAGMAPADLASRYPGVKHWILMAVAWTLEQREMAMIVTRGKAGFQELPEDFLVGLLDPITLRTRF
ncbi:MAG TPA: hypothetical protein VJ654_03000 [Noviherbaspirillum sp.]|nr:hypothetical protein [Noviherbaspirillum sp.]